jgi:hypothetical protein
LFRRKVLNPDPIAFFDDLGNPSPVAMPMIALIAENADRS